MKFPFQKMRLEAESLYSLISTWAEMQLTVTNGTAAIRGYGYRQDIARAFTSLVLDWEAVILLPAEELELEAGDYDLIRLDQALYACRDQQKFLLTDRPVVVEVNSEPES